MCAQGPDPQALRGTLSVLIMQLSRPVHGSSSSSTVAELVFEEAMLLQLYKARIQPARLDADGKLLSGLNQTFSALKQAPASDQSKATFKTRLKVGVCRFALAISYAQLQDDGQLLLLFVCFVDVLPVGWKRSPTAILSTVAHWRHYAMRSAPPLLETHKRQASKRVLSFHHAFADPTRQHTVQLEFATRSGCSICHQCSLHHGMHTRQALLPPLVGHPHHNPCSSTDSVSGFSSAVVAALLLQYLQLVPNTVQPTNIFRLMQRIVEHSS